MRQYEANPDSIATAWSIAPAAIAWPGRTAGLSAAVFAGEAAKGLEVSSPPDSATHVLAVATIAQDVALTIDGREVHRGFVEAGAVQLVQAGERPAAIVMGQWRVIHFFIPANDLTQLAEDIGLCTTAARELAFTIPSLAREPVLGRIGRRLDQRLSRGDLPSRLELDELSLTIGCRLIRAHSTAKPPRTRRSASLSGPERRRLLDVLSHDDNPGLDELARRLDRCVAETEQAFLKNFHATPQHIRAKLKRSQI